MKLLDFSIQQRIDEKCQRLNQLRPLPASAIKKLQEQFKIEMTYNSNGIEGNSLTLKETFLVINEGITIKGKPLKDHLEATDHYQALDYLYKLVEHGVKVTISEQLIRILHELIMQKTDQEWAGSYRNSDVFIAGADHTPPDASAVPVAMRQFIQWFTKNRKKIHPVELAALVHHKIVYIHPFFDGNGRTARLVMNILLMRQGYPLVIILKNDRRKYYRVLDKADKGNNLPLVMFIAQAVERSLDIYLRTLTPVTQKREEFTSLKKLSRESQFSAKYLNLLVRLGKLEAHKEGRNWLTSREALKRYLEKRQRQRKLSSKNNK